MVSLKNSRTHFSLSRIIRVEGGSPSTLRKFAVSHGKNGSSMYFCSATSLGVGTSCLPSCVRNYKKVGQKMSMLQKIQHPVDHCVFVNFIFFSSVIVVGEMVKMPRV